MFFFTLLLCLQCGVDEICCAFLHHLFTLTFIYRVAHNYLFHCLKRVYRTRTENFYNISTVLKTLIKMLLNISTLRYNN